MLRTLGQRELLDQPSLATRQEIEGNLADIAFANRWLGGVSLVLSHLKRLVCIPPQRQPVRVLDMATGSADIPVAIALWAQRVGITIQITAVDNNPEVVEIARMNVRSFPQICIDQQDILHLPYKPQLFDFVICSQVMHHLENDQAVAALQSANRLSTQGIIVSDLRRRKLCTGLAEAGTHLVSNRLSRHDGKVSFENAFTPGEMRELAELAGLPHYKVYHHGPCRLALISDKRTTICERAKGIAHVYHSLAAV